MATSRNAGQGLRPTAPAAAPIKTGPLGHAHLAVVTLDVVGQLLTLSEREAEELRRAAAAEAGRSSARRDLSLLLERGLQTHATVVLNRAEARELAELLDGNGFRANFALMQEALRGALNQPPSAAALRLAAEQKATPPGAIGPGP